MSDRIRRLEIQIVDAQLQLADQALRVQNSRGRGHPFQAELGMEVLDLLKRDLSALRKRRRVLLQGRRVPQLRTSPSGATQRLHRARNARDLINAVSDMLLEEGSVPASSVRASSAVHASSGEA